MYHCINYGKKTLKFVTSTFPFAIIVEGLCVFVEKQKES